MCLLAVAASLIPLSVFAGDLKGVTDFQCYDGDTCTVNIPSLPYVFGHHLSIRLRGIDAPEIKGRCERETAKAIVAREYLRSRMRTAKVLEFKDATRDKYFRVDVTVIADGTNLNEELVAMGFARRYDGKTRGSWCP